MQRTENLVSAFREIVGDAHVVADQDKLKSLAVDDVIPGLMVSPGTIAETSKVMAVAHGLGLAVLPRGGGTKMSLGGIPARADLILSTKRMNGYADYDIANLTIEVECGATVAEVQAKLSAEGEGYFLPLDPPHFREATIGGVVAANSNGPRRLLYGGLRDIILGNTAVLANGDIVHAGGKVMKNVASYDLTKLLIGSLGALGLICRTTFRIYLKPEAEATLFLAFADLKDADAFFHKALPSFYYPAALELLNAQAAAACRNLLPLSGEYLVAVGLEGISEAVERQIADMTEMGRKSGAQGTASLKGDGHRGFWISYSDFTDELAKNHSDLIILKSNFAISRQTQVMAAAEKAVRKGGCECALACHAGSGILTTAILAGRDVEKKEGEIIKIIEDMTDMAVKSDGNLIVEKAPRFIKENVSVWGKIGADVGLVKGLKEKFDSNGVINPGRYVGGI